MKTFDAKLAVSSLASAQTLEFAGFSSKNAAINLGNISVDFALVRNYLLLIQPKQLNQELYHPNNSLTSL